jgi:hypothetical protein
LRPIEDPQDGNGKVRGLPGFGNVTAIGALLLVCAHPSPLLCNLLEVRNSFRTPVYKGHKQAINNHRKTRSAAHSEPVAVDIAAASIKASVFSDSEVLPLPPDLPQGSKRAIWAKKRYTFIRHNTW